MATGSNVKEDVLSERLRQCLNRDKVRLWLSPYTTETGERGQIPDELIAKYCTELGLKDPGELANSLEQLRLHALEKLAARRKFQESGLATLKIKMAGNLPEEKRDLKNLSLEISVKVRGGDLKHAISQHTGIDPHRLKLITSGTVVEDTKVLQDQKITNGSQVMALCLSEMEAEARSYQEQMERVAKTREAAEILSAKDDGGDNDDQNYYLQIADQSGKPIDLPQEERKALVLAMTLHEKGRASLGRKEYGEALLLLLEADKEFKKCRSDILNAVDNYALVCLDIVWCYLLLKNVNDLPDAETRLKACDDCFRKSYGPNLERLALVKGGTGSERALFMRLHLLQGILAFHQHRQHEAAALLSRAESELLSLQVNEDKMTQVMEMGFTPQEARLGLRQCEGNVQLAVSHIMKRREEKKAIKEEEKEKKRKKRLARKLGQTASGQDVDIPMYENLLRMGFPKGASAEALRQANNNLELALQVLQDHPELLTLPDPDPPEFKVTDEMLTQVLGMGFDLDSARAALHHFQGSVQQAIEELLRNGGMVPFEWLQAVPSTSSSESSSPTKSSDEKKKEEEAIKSIIPDIPEGEEDHLDLLLEEEFHFLQEYKALLASMQ